MYMKVAKGVDVDVSIHEKQLAVAQETLMPATIKKVLDILASLLPNRIFGGGNLMVASSREVAHAKKVMVENKYAPFNPTDFLWQGPIPRRKESKLRKYSIVKVGWSPHNLERYLTMAYPRKQ